jgi:hypothetical protein
MTARKENGIYVVREVLGVDRYDFDGTAEELKANIDLIVEKACAMGMVGEGRFDFDLDFDLMRTGYYDGYCELKVTYDFDRVENEREKTKREDAEAKMKEAAAAKRKATGEARKLKKDAEYAEYLRLKEKFKEV